MLLITDLNDIPTLNRTSALTIGFDGVHLGHQALFQHLKDKLPPDGILTALTFSNHPSHLFTPDSPTPLIYSPLQKVKLLFESGVDNVILIPFTKEFALTPFDSFLKKLKSSLCFSYLALGTGAVFGKNREGNEANIRQLSPQLEFEVDYLPKFLLNGAPVSSGRIRTLISQADFPAAKNCLGRPYSLMGRLTAGEMHFPGICLPPEGSYPIHLKTALQTFLGNAHVSPKTSQIHLDLKIPLADQDAEVIF
jgi:riboflavin kinase/FMN adenylyltransferase